MGLFFVCLTATAADNSGEGEPAAISRDTGPRREMLGEGYPMHLRFLLTLLSFLFFQSDPTGGDPKDPPKDDEVKFDEKQQKKINDMLAAERKSAEDRTAQRLKDEAAQQAQKDKDERERKEAEARGEFDQVKASLESERDAAAQERDRLKAERETLSEYVKADIAAVTKTVKDAKDSPAAKALMRFYPGDDADPLTLLDWAKEAKALLPELTAKQSPRGNGQDPKPGIDSKIDVNKEIERKARSYRL